MRKMTLASNKSFKSGPPNRYAVFAALYLKRYGFSFRLSCLGR